MKFCGPFQFFYKMVISFEKICFKNYLFGATEILKFPVHAALGNLVERTCSAGNYLSEG